jgi:ferredoxin-NADP reductase
MLTTAKTPLSATIESKTQLTADVIELRLSRPVDFDYSAGQFIQFLVSDAEPRVRRSYSLSSTPAHPYLELCIKLIPGGIGSTHIGNKSVGDTFDFIGPQGKFVVNTPSSITCIATGVGLAPIMGIIEDELTNKKNTAPINLLFGVRNETDIFWLDRLETLARDYANFHYILTLSQPSSSWQSHHGRVTAHLPGVSNLEQQFYLCGSLDMVKDVKHHLTTIGVPAPNVHFEIF